MVSPNYIQILLLDISATLINKSKAIATSCNSDLNKLDFVLSFDRWVPWVFPSQYRGMSLFMETGYTSSSSRIPASMDLNFQVLRIWNNLSQLGTML